jgi:hypothetical protein
MEVPNLLAKKNSTDPTQRRISDVAIFPRHGTCRDTATKPIAHHEVGTSTELGDEGIQIG